MIDKSRYTHDAYIFKSEGIRKGRRVGFPVNEGVGRIEPDGSISVYLHSTPIGGFDGRIVCRKFGSKPPDFDEEKPQRPGEPNAEDETAEESA